MQIICNWSPTAEDLLPIHICTKKRLLLCSKSWNNKGREVKKVSQLFGEKNKSLLLLWYLKVLSLFNFTFKRFVIRHHHLPNLAKGKWKNKGHILVALPAGVMWYQHHPCRTSTEQVIRINMYAFPHSCLPPVLHHVVSNPKRKFKNIFHYARSFVAKRPFSAFFSCCCCWCLLHQNYAIYAKDPINILWFR